MNKEWQKSSRSHSHSSIQDVEQSAKKHTQKSGTDYECISSLACLFACLPKIDFIKNENEIIKVKHGHSSHAIHNSR